MSTGGGSENITVSTGSNPASSDTSDLYARATSWLKSWLRWSLACEEVAQREQTRIEKLVGPIGHDPTAPSDLNTVTETLWFDSASIIAALIVTFFVFYFIDFFIQMFGGVASMVTADSTPSIVNIQPVIPTRTRRRRKGSTSLSKESSSTQGSSTGGWFTDITQNTITPVPSPAPMKDILTKSIRPNFSRELCTTPSNAPPTPSQQNQPDSSGVKFDNTPKVSPDRKLAGRSPQFMEATPRPVTTDGDPFKWPTELEGCNSSEWLALRNLNTSLSRVLRSVEDKQTQTCWEVRNPYKEDHDDTSSVEYQCSGLLDEEPMLHRGDHVYEEKHDLPYADDLSGEEFDSYRYEQAQAYLEYMNQLDEIRTEFSVDDISNPDQLLDEWEDPQENVPASPTTPVTKPTSDDEISDTLFGQAEDIFNQLQEQSQMRGRTEILKEVSRRIWAHQREEKHATGGEHMNSGLLEDDSPGRLRRSLEMSDLRPSSHIDAPKEEVQLPGSVHHHLDEFPTSDRTDDVDAAGAEGDIDDAEWEVPRSLQLPNHEDFVPPAESLLSTLDDNTLLDDGDRIARSISSFSIRQSMQIRHYHHVVFTYPDPTPYKVLLTGSFFGWKMSLPMQRERGAFRLSITLPAGEHQYRFQVHRRRPKGNEDEAHFVLHD